MNELRVIKETAADKNLPKDTREGLDVFRKVLENDKPLPRIMMRDAHYKMVREQNPDGIRAYVAFMSD